jgi:hypothetical protein
MNKILTLPLLLILGCMAQPVLAATIALQGTGLSQSDFRALSEDLGSALSYKAVTPAAPLGVTGFDVGVEVTSTSMSQSATAWNKATGDTISNLYIPKLHIAKGLPFGFDVAAFISEVPAAGIKLVGAELRYAIMEGGIALPAIGIRGAYTKLSGVDLLAFDTRSVDVSISKGFAFFTPYAGVGEVWTNSTPDAITGLTAESFSQNKVFYGANLNLGLVNFALEGDKTGNAQSVSAKIGFRF